MPGLESKGVMKKARSMTLLLATLVAAFALAGALPVAADEDGGDYERASGKPGRTPLPSFTINTERGDKCVHPESVMRRDHMKFILHQRDLTMHQGIRTTQHSLKNCINCHADAKTNSVLGKDGFCASCHRYASVSIDCFSCHSDKREPNVAAEATPISAARALKPVAKENKP